MVGDFTIIDVRLPWLRAMSRIKDTLMLNPATFQAPFRFHPFQYGWVQLREATHIDGIPYFTRRAIGEWLEYRRPRKSVGAIIERNPHIENPEWTTVLKLGTVEGERQVGRQVHIYNPIGLQLIVFESRQPKAIEYKIAVAKLVNDIMTGAYNRKLARVFLAATGGKHIQ